MNLAHAAWTAAGLNKRVQLVGTSMWDDPRLSAEPAAQGGWFAAPDPAGFRGFSGRYRSRHGQDGAIAKRGRADGRDQPQRPAGTDDPGELRQEPVGSGNQMQAVDRDDAVHRGSFERQLARIGLKETDGILRLQPAMGGLRAAHHGIGEVALYHRSAESGAREQGEHRATSARNVEDGSTGGLACGVSHDGVDVEQRIS